MSRTPIGAFAESSSYPKVHDPLPLEQFLALEPHEQMQHHMQLQHPPVTYSTPPQTPREAKGLAEMEMVLEQLIREGGHVEVELVLQQLAQEKENMHGLSAEEVRVRIEEGEPVEGVSGLLFGNVFSGGGEMEEEEEEERDGEGNKEDKQEEICEEMRE
ncbi:hypothetical protein K440DRAFT_668644 [Wilcoxina mikolae CBS 423.85]|nr:hypothetical protein K440DRAFT_668644 [Wilcoxina mikolae CBS 423.85]